MRNTRREAKAECEYDDTVLCGSVRTLDETSRGSSFSERIAWDAMEKSWSTAIGHVPMTVPFIYPHKNYAYILIIYAKALDF